MAYSELTTFGAFFLLLGGLLLYEALNNRTGDFPWLFWTSLVSLFVGIALVAFGLWSGRRGHPAWHISTERPS